MEFADEDYNFVTGIHNGIPFHFRDGIKTVTSPISSTTDPVSDEGITFEIEGLLQ